MLLTIVSFFFVLSLLVLVHEFGHYIVAKLAGIGVERFSIGYPPRLFGIQIGDTDYCISGTPFGGYVKLTGQEDFGREEEYVPDPRDYRGKSTPVKIAVLVAGSLMNLLTAVFIFLVLFYIHGAPETTTKIGGVSEGTLAAEMGLKVGDEVVSVQDGAIDRLEELLLPLYTDREVTVTLKDENGVRTVVAPHMLEQQVVCPECNELFTLRKEDSLEHRKKQAKARHAEEERIAKLWLKRSIWAAAFIVASLVGMIAFSVAFRAPLPPPAEEPSEPAPAARSE